MSSSILDTLGSLSIPSSLGMATTETETETEGSAPWAKAEA